VKEAGESRPVYSLKQFKYNSHYWILNFLSRAKPSSRILDIGAANGYLGDILKRQGHFLVGVEADAELAEKARAHYHTLHCADVESFDFPYRKEFDYILLADVLEHLRDPTNLLRLVVPCLKDRGELIISIPNVAHLFIRMALMAGRFEYQDRGILDRTHLRFFTLSSMKRMIDDAACRIVELKPTSVPVQLVAPWTDNGFFAPLHELNYLAVRLCKTLLAYQFVVRAIPKGGESR
jgi:2-polyprenyl-3-methyl-5-hydroxy-6-metoxy-1,4-benzoquinol methylase